MVFRSRTNGHCAKRKVKIYEKAKVHEKVFGLFRYFRLLYFTLRTVTVGSG